MPPDNDARPPARQEIISLTAYIITHSFGSLFGRNLNTFVNRVWPCVVISSGSIECTGRYKESASPLDKSERVSEMSEKQNPFPLDHHQQQEPGL